MLNAFKVKSKERLIKGKLKPAFTILLGRKKKKYENNSNSSSADS